MYLCSLEKYNLKIVIMATLMIKYNARNLYLKRMLDAITQMQGVEVLEKEVLTLAEIRSIEKSRKSVFFVRYR